MKGSSNIVSAIQHLKMAQEHFESFAREHPGSKGAALFLGYSKRINWVFTDLKTHPMLPDVVREGIRREINSDVFAVPAIAEKAALLPPSRRDEVEDFIDKIIEESKV